MKKNKKNLITVTLLLLLSCVLSVNGYTVYATETEETENDNIASGGDENLTWVIDSKGCLTITGTGDYKLVDSGGFSPYDFPEWHEYCLQVTSAIVNVENITSTANMFSCCYNLTNVDLSGLDTTNVTNMSGMFEECQSLTKLDLSNFDTTNVTDMGDMFHGCTNLTELKIDKFVTDNVINMQYMFSSCNRLTSLNLDNFNTTNVGTMGGMFSYCSSLTSLNLDNFNTTNVGDMSNMFRGCDNLTSLDLSSFNTSEVRDMGGMFSGCSNLTSLDLSGFDTRLVGDMNSMFYDCSSLTSLNFSNFDVSSLAFMNDMFYNCSSLTTLDLSNWVLHYFANGLFNGCDSLTSIISPQRTPGNIYLPVVKNYIWKDSNGNIVKSIPANSTSTTYTRYYVEPDTEVVPPEKKPDDNNNNNNNDGNQTNRTDNTEPQLPAVGTKQTVSNGVYKVTKSSSTNKEVTFTKSKSNKKTSLTIPATVKIDGQTYKVTEVEAKAFKNNKKLKSVTIGKNVKKIGKEAFSGCSKLNKITIKSTVLKSVGKNAIKGINAKATIKCPKKQLEKYKKLFKSSTGYKKSMKIKK